MRVTIISDASYCPNNRVGGYGFWAVSGRGSHAGEGMFKGSVPSAQNAEMMAIVNALHCSIGTGVAIAGDQVLVQTDCLNAITYFERKSRRISADALVIVNALDALKAKHSLDIEFRHVKGHTRQTGTKFVAQRLSDKRARRAMKKARRAVSASAERS